MVTAERVVASDATFLGEVAAALRLLSKQDGEADGRQLAANLEAVAAELEMAAEEGAAQPGGEARHRALEIRCLRLKARQVRYLAWTYDSVISARLLKLAKEMEEGADQLQRSTGPVAAARRLLAFRRQSAIRSASTAPSIAPLRARAQAVLGARRARIAVASLAAAMVIGLAIAASGGYRWFLPAGASPIDDMLGPRASSVPPPSLALTAPPEPTLPAAPPIEATPPPAASVQPPPPAWTAVAMPAELLAAGILARQRQSAKPTTTTEQKPRPVARIADTAEAPPPSLRELDRSGGDRAAVAPSPPPSDAADPPPPEQAAALPPPAPASARPIPLVTPAAPSPAPGGDTQAPLVDATPPPGPRDCVPYISDTTLDGRSAPVQGLACRDAKGQWRRMSETPR